MKGTRKNLYGHNHISKQASDRIEKPRQDVSLLENQLEAYAEKAQSYRTCNTEQNDRAQSWQIVGVSQSKEDDAGGEE